MKINARRSHSYQGIAAFLLSSSSLRSFPTLAGFRKRIEEKRNSCWAKYPLRIMTKICTCFLTIFSITLRLFNKSQSRVRENEIGVFERNRRGSSSAFRVAWIRDVPSTTSSFSRSAPRFRRDATRPRTDENAEQKQRRGLSGRNRRGGWEGVFLCMHSTRPGT